MPLAKADVALRRTLRGSTGNLTLLDGSRISSLHAVRSTVLSASAAVGPRASGVSGLGRSKSLNQLLVNRRQAADIHKQHARRQRRHSLAKTLGCVALSVAAPVVLVACVLGLVEVPHGVAALVGLPEASGDGGVSGTLVSDAFALSSSKLEALRFGPDGAVPVLPFLDALDALSPAYESMGVMFTVASKEVTGNSKKLRLLHADAQAPSRAAEANESGGSSSSVGSSSILGGSFGGGSSASAQSLQDLLLATAPKAPVRPATPAAEARAAAFAAAAAGRGSVDAFEAGRWLGFALHMMELLYGCIGARGLPGQCATMAYDRALKPHQNLAMRTLASGVLRLVPNSPEALRERTGVPAAGFVDMMRRWSAAVQKPRLELEAFYAQWPEHKG